MAAIGGAVVALLVAASCGSPPAVRLTSGYHQVSESIAVDGRTYSITSSCVRSPSRACTTGRGGYSLDSTVCYKLPGWQDDDVDGIMVTLDVNIKQIQIYRTWVAYSSGFQQQTYGDGGVTHFNLSRGADVDWAAKGHRIQGSVHCA